MFWVGRLNAVMFLSAVIGFFAFLMVQGPESAFAWLVFLFVVRVVLKVADLLWTVFTGNPLFYQVKVLPPRERREPRE